MIRKHHGTRYYNKTINELYLCFR